MQDLLGGQTRELKERLNQAQLAERLGVSAPYVHKLKEKGVITFGPDGKVDAEEAVAAVLDYTNIARSEKLKKAREKSEASAGPASAADEVEPGMLPFADSQRRAAHYKALLAELEYREREGELVRKELMRQTAAGIGRKTFEVLMNIPARTSAIYAAEPDPDVIYRQQKKDLLEALTGLRQWIRREFDKTFEFETPSPGAGAPPSPPRGEGMTDG
jgi:phage terminase Nu1 subunit (DNA packaging protein)